MIGAYKHGTSPAPQHEPVLIERDFKYKPEKVKLLIR